MCLSIVHPCRHQSFFYILCRYRTVDLAEFMLLELLRTEATNPEEIEYLKALFESMQTDNSNTVEYDGVEEEAGEEGEEDGVEKGSDQDDSV